MKLTLKLLLALLIFIAAIYTFSPLWLPHVLGRQLPAGWQLEQIKTDYPGASAIKVPTLKIKGTLETADVTLAATGIDFSYRDFKTDIASMTLDVRLRDAEDINSDTVTLDDLSLPLVDMTGKIPELSVTSLRMRLHHVQADATDRTQPLTLDFGSLNLVPGPNNSYRLVTDLSFESIPVARGLLELDISRDSQSAKIQFPADPDSAKWLSLQAQQVARSGDQHTHIQAIFDAGKAEQKWLDSILLRGSGGFIKHIDGQMQASAEFAGTERHQIQQLSLKTENLQLRADGESLSLKTNLLASRAQRDIHVKLPDQTVIQYQDGTGRIDRLLNDALPQFQRAARGEVETVLSLESGSGFTFKAGSPSVVHFTGGLRLGLDAVDETLVLQSNGISIAVTDFTRFESMTVDGPAHIEWNENKAIGFAFPDFAITAEGLSVAAELSSVNGTIISTGGGSLLESDLADLATSADRLDFRWQDLDLLDRTGSFFTQTHGFKNITDGETWTGFDVNLNYQVIHGKQLDGSGTVTFDKGPGLPIKFNGNIDSGQWKITLPPASIKPAQVVKLLKVVHADLPPSVKLANGLLDLQGEIVVDDRVKATMALHGHAFDATFKESGADNIEFSFNTVLDQDVSLDGPVSIEKIALAGGIDLTGIKAELRMTGTDTLTMKDIQAGVFEGRLHLASLRYANNEIADTRADFTHINLERIFAFADIDGLEGSGYLDLSLPVSQNPSGIIIHNGTFNSTVPGRLSYARMGVAAANIGMQALENFHYKHLSGTVNYEADGQYQIAIRLEGSNPDLYDGYPVVFNLNITGTMPKLFESMFITGSFEEAILDQVKSR